MKWRKSSKDKKIQKINEFLKVLPESQIDQALEALVYGRISAVQKTKYVESTTETKIVESDKVTETTEKIQEATDLETKKAEWKNMQKHLDNKITFDFNASGNLNATSGKIDEAVEIIESMNPKPKCVKISKVPFGERKGLKTLFVNINSKYNGIPTNRKHTEALLKKIGFEAVMP